MTVADVGPPQLDEVSDGIYSYVQPDGTWFINNMGFVVGSDHVVSIDTTSTEARNRAYLDAIRSVTDAPVTTVVNTHHHADHTHGNYLFEDAAIVAHERCRDVMMRTGIPDYRAAFPDVVWGNLRFKAPTMTFTGSLTLHVDDLTLELFDLGYVAHTDGDVLVWIPERDVLFTGDLIFHGGTPFALFGSIQGTLDALDRIEAQGAAVIVPGHGPAFGGDRIPGVLDAQRAYLRFVADTAQRGVADGLTPVECARATDLGEFASLTDSERLAGNLHVAYREVGGDTRTPVDTGAAIMDMIAYNDGHLPRCVA